MLRTLLNMSIFVKLLTKLWRGYCLFEVWLGEIYRNSYTGRLTQGLWNKIKICFRYSFLGKITEIKEEGNNPVIDESIIARQLKNSYKKFKPQAVYYFKSSRINNSLNELIKEFYLSPLKSISIIVVVTVPINIIFSILLKREIGILGWFIRILLLLIGLGGLSSNAAWSDVKRTSYFLRKAK